MVERLSYDAWGKRRFANGQDDPSGGIASQTTRGFTGHEELADVGLIHMNGRVYDPMLGRFGTPDPMTESPFSTQGWNRYSYVGNSPLNFTDPSGYCFAGCFWQQPFKALGAAIRRTPILGNILQVAAAAICTASIACAPLAPVIAGLASAAVTGLASGDLGQALKAGAIALATAIAFNAVGDITGHTPGFGTGDHIANIVGHAAVGCGSAVASGGKCGPGALSGAVGSFVTPLTRGLDFIPRLVATSVSGGLASVAGGGKFGNGAVTAAFGYLFNHLGHMLVGTDAHHQLLSYLQGRDGSLWSGNTTFGGLFGDGRPDLIYDAMPREVFEIKPEGSEIAGATQLQGYLNTPGSQSKAGDFDLIFRGGPSLTLRGGWFGETNYIYTPSTLPGVVTYTVGNSDAYNQGLRLFNQRPAGGGLPLPPRLPPILIP